MSKLRPPGELTFDSGNQAENWRMWRQEMELYQQLSMADDSEKDKCAAFLYLIGRRGREVYNTWTLEEDERDNIRVLYNKFANYFQPKQNIILERYKFNLKTQAEGETLDEFVTEITGQARLCKYGTLESEMIRDRIVVGISRTEVKDRLLREPDLTLDSAITICRADEESRKGLDILQPKQQQSTSIDAIQHKDKPSYNKRPQMEKCTRCGGRHGKVCPAFGTKCAKCKKLNHWAKMCKSRDPKNVHQIEEDSDSEAESFIGAVYSKHKQDGQAYITTSVLGMDVKFKLDTGAQANILPWSMFLKLRLKRKVRLIITKNKLTSYSGDSLQVKGTCKLSVLDRVVKFYVVDTVMEPILGFNACEELKLVKILQIQESKCEHPLLEEFKDVFTGLGKLENQYHIETDTNCKPVVHAPRKIPFSLLDKVKKELDKMENMQVIKKQDRPTEWVNSMVVVEKKNGSLRICMDPRDLNMAIKREHYGLSSLDDIVSKLNGAKYFAKFDAAHGFWQIELDEDSSKLCTMNTPFGRYSFLRCPFGISSAPEVFNKRIKQLFMNEDGIDSFFDDVLVWGQTEEELEERCRRCLDIARKANLKFRKEKTVMSQSEVKYLGHVLSAEGTRADPDKTKAIKALKITDVKSLQRYLGMVTYLGKYIPHLSDLTAPLRELTKEDIQWHWMETHDEAVKNINKSITESPILKHFDPNKEVTITADASSYGLGAALLQDGLPIAYASRTLNKSEQNYAQIEKETLAVVFACSKFHQYIYGQIVTVESDHKPLQYIFAKTLEKCPPRIQRFLIALQKYNLKIKYVPGKNLQLADALSRDPLSNDKEFQEIEEQANIQVHTLLENISVSQDENEKLKNDISQDEQLLALKEIIAKGWPAEKAKVPETLKPFWDVRDTLTFENGNILKGEQLFISKGLRKDILKKLHVGHMGIEMTTRRAREAVYWPGMSKDIAQLVSQCDTCQRHRNQQPKETLKSHEQGTYPWQKVATDVFTWNNKEYLLVVDYFSKYVEIAYLQNTSSATVTIHLKSIFSRHGIPETIFSDNASYYTSKTFKSFLADWGIHHKTSSPLYPQSNGLAERMVQTIKRLLKKSNDPYLALLMYRTTPGKETPSPASLMFGRKLRTNLPARQKDFFTCHSDKVKKSHISSQSYQKRYYQGRDLPNNLKPGSDVFFKTAGEKLWQPASLVRQTDDPRSFIVQRGTKVYRRNRRHILRPSDNYQHSYQEPVFDRDSGDLAATQTTPTVPTVTDDPSPDTSCYQPLNEQTNYKTRSGRCVIKPKYLDDFSEK